MALCVEICLHRKNASVQQREGVNLKINIRELLAGEKSQKEFEYSIPAEYNEGGNEAVGDILVSGKVTDMGGYIELNASAELKYRTQCARCLTELERNCKIDICRPVTVSLQNGNEEDEYILVGENSEIDIDNLITEELLLSLPLRSLCSEDCKGLCPKCGCNRNEVKCDCTDKEPDPRWAALRNLKFGE